MSILSEIQRIQQAKAALKSSINAKGGMITDETLDEYASAINNLPSGSSGDLTIEGQQIITGILTGTVDEFDTVYSKIVGDTTLISPAFNEVPLEYDDIGYASESGVENDEIEMISIFR